MFKLPELKISTLADRKVYHDWWEQQLADQKALIADLEAKWKLSRLSDLDFKYYKAMSQFADNVLEILSLVSDTLRPATWEDFLRHGFSDPRPDKPGGA